MAVSAYFSASYAEARGKFLAACAEAGSPVTSYRNSVAAGPAGEELYTDVARLGPDHADNVLVVMSGTHGVEGFCGSGCQCGLLRERFDDELPPKTSLVFVHALNAYGFAHLRRVNEDNVDVNRNHIDHDQPPPANPTYDELHALLLPVDWGGPGRMEADEALRDLIAARGLRYVQGGLTRGQYDHPDGLFYGGRRPVWSNTMWRTIVREYVAGHRRVAFVDLHSGLGRYGYGEPIFRGRFDESGYGRARAWYGDSVTSSEDGTSSSTDIMGNTAAALAEETGDAELTAITLEFGTVPASEVLNALRADHWLHAHAGDPMSTLGETVKTTMRDAFYCDSDDWKQLVWTRCGEILLRSLAGLAAS